MQRNQNRNASGCFLSAFTCNVMPKDAPRKTAPEDYEIYNDPIGVMCFLPPRRCKNCDD